MCGSRRSSGMCSGIGHPGTGETAVEQRRPKLGTLHALVTDLVRKLFVLRCGRAEMGSRVRERRLLAEQQEQSEQQMHDGAAGLHGQSRCAGLAQSPPRLEV